MTKKFFAKNFIRAYKTQCLAGGTNRYVIGCGSNVVDQLFRVQGLPKPGEKGFFKSPTKILEKSVVGGVTLNHLAWASLFGVPTGLLALQGDDSSGRIIRNKLKELGILRDFIQVDKNYTTAESYVFIQEDGERSIIMASGATSLINENIARQYFGSVIEKHASIFTTEISQVPFEGVIQMLKIARNSNVLTVVDFDISPQVAFSEAKLGTLNQLKEILNLCDILKPAKHAASEWIQLLKPNVKRDLSPTDVSKYLIDDTSAKLVALTNGHKPSILTTNQCSVEVDTESLEGVGGLKGVIDATGAGDAFLGGLVAGIYFNGFPNTENELWDLGKLANQSGAANCMVLGGLPEESSRLKLANEINRFKSFEQGNTPIGTIGKITQPSLSHDIKTIFNESNLQDHNALHNCLNFLNYKNIENVVDIILSCKGNLFTTGIGKSGIVCQRMAASLSSVGCPSHYVHIGEWVHGDLGKVTANDVVIIISHSGKTQEIIDVIPHFKSRDIPIVAIVGNKDSSLGKMFTRTCICYDGENIKEPLGGVPTVSLILQESIVNGLINVIIESKRLSRQNFLYNHPGGSLGQKLNDEN